MQPIRAFDLNAYPEDEDDVEGVGTRPSGGEVVLVGDSSNGEGEDAKGKRAVDLSLETRSAVEDNVETSLTFAPSSTDVHAMDPIGCEIAKALVYMSHKEHVRVISKTS